MMELDIHEIALAAVAGAAVASAYFAGLWWTVRRLPDSRNPGLLIGASLVTRLAVALVGFHLAGQGRWEGLAACLGGFLVARTFVIRRLGLDRMKDRAEAARPAAPSPLPSLPDDENRSRRRSMSPGLQQADSSDESRVPKP